MNRTERYAAKNWPGFLLFVLLTLFPAADAMAQGYLGKYCWTLTITTRETGSVTPETFAFQADVLYLGGESYSLNGKVVPSGDNPAVYSGTGIVIGGTLYASMAGSQSHASSGWQDSSVMHLELDVSTLNGTMYDVGNDFNPSTKEFTRRYTAGSAALTTCP